MTTITLQLPDEQAQMLAKEAKKNGLSLEAYAEAQLLDSISKGVGNVSVYDLIDHIVEENTELYKRLA